MKYTAGWNTPGFLPEADVFETDDLEEAVSHLIEVAQSFLDEDLQAAVNTSDEVKAHEKWQVVIVDIQSFGTEPQEYLEVYNGDFSVVFWVNGYEGEVE